VIERIRLNSNIWGLAEQVSSAIFNAIADWLSQ